jgi:hypothetical protein
MKSVLSLSRFALVLSLLTIALGNSHSVSAQIDIGYRNIYELSSIGVARGQQARLSVFYRNVFPPGPCAPGETCRPVGSFAASMTFADCDGNIVARNDVTLIPEKGGALMFTPTNFMGDGRACARATVTVQPDANGFLPDLVPTVEVLDAVTGQSQLINPGSVSGFNPQPEPPGDRNFGLFNVVKGQTARVSAALVNVPEGFPPGPCRVTFTFYGGDGQQISESTIPLNVGQTGYFDFPTTGFPNGARARIRASVHVDASDRGALPGVVTAVEVFAADTGKSSLYYPGMMIGSN